MNTHDVVDLVTTSPIDQITQLLASSGHPEPEKWLIGLHPDAYLTQDTNLQIFFINRQWRQILSAFGELTQTKTMDERYCLVDNAAKMEDWFRCFKDGVLPCILKNNLPLITV